MVEASGGDCVRELHGMPRAFDVGKLLLLRARLQVVDGGKMEKMFDFAFEFLPIGGRYAEIGFSKVADDWNQLVFGGVALLAQRLEFFRRPAANQHINRFAAPNQAAHDKSSDEAGRAGHEIGQGFTPSMMRW